MSLVESSGLLNQLTKTLLESAPEAELTADLCHDHGQTVIAAIVRDCTRVKAVLT